MATLNENVAMVKQGFAGVKAVTNGLCDVFLGETPIGDSTPVDEYGRILNEAINDVYYTGEGDGIERGKSEILAESKYIPKSATGKVISLTDVSEVAHKVKVYGDNQEVDVYGKNLLPYPYEYNNIYGTSHTVKGVTFTTNDDGSITVEGVNNGISVSQVQLAKSIELAVGKTYTLSMGTSNPNISARFQYTKSGSTGYLYTTTYTHAEGNVINQIFLDVATGATVNETIHPIVYEKDTKQTITATSEGTEIDSMCPNMNFFADEDITVDYYSSFGMQTEYDRFWDSLQNGGNRLVYNYAFGYDNFTNATFKPKYDIKPTSALSMFQNSDKSLVGNLKAILEECGIVLDLSKATSVSNAFAYCDFDTLPEINITSASNAQGLFWGCTAKWIDGLVLKSDGSQTFTNSFNVCSKLTHCIFSGIIASDINLQWSKLLDDESLISLAVSLYNFVFDDLNLGGAFTKTITLSEESWAKMDSLIYPDTEVSCKTVIDGKGWKRA